MKVLKLIWRYLSSPCVCVCVSGCLVSPEITLSLGGRQTSRREFWGLVGPAGSVPVMKVKAGMVNKFEKVSVSLTHTHAVGTLVELMEARPLTWRVDGNVTGGWRRFLMEAAWHTGTLRLSLIDDHGTHWLAGMPPLRSPQWVRLTVPHFNTSCHARESL